MAATTKATAASTTPAPAPAVGLWPCLMDQFGQIQKDISVAFNVMTAEGLCGADTIKTFTGQLTQTVADFQKCAELGCYFKYLPIVKNEVLAVGLRCTQNFLRNGPFIQALNRAYEIVDKCLIKPNVAF